MNDLTTPRVLSFLALALVIAGNAAGNILLKYGALAAVERPALFGFINWQTVVGIACFAFGILSYAWALKHVDLHVAQIALSLQYVAVIILASILLGEHVSPYQWAGIGLIAFGLFLCTR